MGCILGQIFVLLVIVLVVFSMTVVPWCTLLMYVVLVHLHVVCLSYIPILESPSTNMVDCSSCSGCCIVLVVFSMTVVPWCPLLMYIVLVHSHVVCLSYIPILEIPSTNMVACSSCFWLSTSIHPLPTFVIIMVVVHLFRILFPVLSQYTTIITHVLSGPFIISLSINLKFASITCSVCVLDIL